MKETTGGHLEPEIGAVDGLVCMLYFIFIYNVMLNNLLHCILPLLSPRTHSFIPTNHTDSSGSSKGKTVYVDDQLDDEWQPMMGMRV